MRFILTDKTGEKFELIRSRMLVSFCLVLCVSAAVVGGLQTQSDDTDPLQLLLQQQAMDIQRQTAELRELYSSMKALQDTVQQLTETADKTAQGHAKKDHCRDKEPCHLAVYLNSGDLSATVPANPLQQVVQQQALDIQRQAAELTALQDAVSSLQNRANKTVAFTAYPSSDPITTTNQGVLRLDVVVSNIGNGYNTATGIFTAPYSGTYLFLLKIMIPVKDSETVTFAIYKSGTEIAKAYANKDNTWDKDSCHATVHLDSGDMVWVGHFNNGRTLVGEMWTTFSGMLLIAD